MSKKSKRMFAVLLGAFMTVQCAAFVPASAEVSEDNPNLIVNGGFESPDKAGWDRENFNILSASDTIKPYEGEYYAKLWGGGQWFYQEVAVEENTQYNLSFAYFNQSNTYMDQLRVIVLGDGGVADGAIKSGKSLIGETNTEKVTKSGKLYDISKDAWTKTAESFNTGENEKIYIIIANDGTTGMPYDGTVSSACIDGIKLQKKLTLDNGSFENGTSGWTGQFSVENTPFTGCDGNSFARLWGNRGTWFCQVMSVEKNTRYNFSFAHRNNSENNGALRVLIAGNNGVNNSGISNDGTSLIGEQDTETTTHYNAGKVYTTKNVWTKETESFNSGNNTTIYIVIKNYNTTDGLSTDEKTNLSPRVDAFELSEVGNTEILNGGFENGTNGWEKPFTLCTGTEENPAYEGSSYARLWGTGWSIYQRVNVEKNTDYTLKFAYKNTIINGNSNNLRVYVAGNSGINEKCIPVNGNSLIGIANNVYPTESGILYDVADKWTEVTQSFNTGNNSKIWVVFRHDGFNAGDNYKGMSIDGVSLKKVPEITVKNANAAKTDNKISFSAKLYNGKIEDTINTYVIAAVYDPNGKLVGTAAKNADIAYGAQAQDYSAEITLEEEMNLTGYTAAIYLWNRTSNMPYTQKTSVTITSDN